MAAPHYRLLFLAYCLPPAAAPQASAARQFAYANIGWILSLVSATLGQTQPNLTSYQATIGGSIPDAAGDELNGVVRLNPGDDPTTGMAKLDSISAQAAVGQLQANVATLTAGLASTPRLAGQLQQIVLSVIPIGRSGT